MAEKSRSEAKLDLGRRVTAEAVGTGMLLAAVATALFRWLLPSWPETAEAVVVPHHEQENP